MRLRRPVGASLGSESVGAKTHLATSCGTPSPVSTPASPAPRASGPAAAAAHTSVLHAMPGTHTR